jgi:hypothetical protein
MAVVGNTFLYDVADTINPRLVCRATDTTIHLIDGNNIAYTTVSAGHVVIVRRNLTTGAESRVAQLRVDPQPYYYGRIGWTWDGALEVYSTYSKPSADGRWVVTVHLWSGGADHILFTIDAGPGGLESRWSPRSILAFSADKKYVAISDFGFAIYGNNIRIFSLADLRQKFVVAASSSGGTWMAGDRFVWAEMGGALKQWSPTAGATVVRSSEWWYGVNASPDGKWLAGTQLSQTNWYASRVFIAPLGVGRTFRTGLASNPGFVTPTVVWYAEEAIDKSPGFSCVEPCAHPTAPDGVIHALDVVNQTDRIVHFHTGQTPRRSSADFYACCSTD